MLICSGHSGAEWPVINQLCLDFNPPTYYLNFERHVWSKGRWGCILGRDISMAYIECSNSHTVTEVRDICKVVSVAGHEILSLSFCFALQSHTEAGITIIFYELVHRSCGETVTSVIIRSSPCAVLVNCPTLLKTPQLPGENITLWLTCNLF
jgi:hypothetical protein